MNIFSVKKIYDFLLNERNISLKLSVFDLNEELFSDFKIKNFKFNKRSPTQSCHISLNHVPPWTQINEHTYKLMPEALIFL
jgi:hypothetical protein